MASTRLRYAILIAALAAVLAGSMPTPARAAPAACSGLAPAPGQSYAEYATGARRRDCLKPWTILVYMAADNDLGPYALWDLYEMEAGYPSHRIAAGSTKRADLLVQLATPGQTQARRIHVFQSPEPYDDALTLEDFRHRSVSEIHSPVAALVPRDEGGKPVPAATDLERFVEWGIREYPAEHYMVIVWGHGQGWGAPSAVPGFAGQDFAGRHFGGLAFSDSGQTFLDIPSLHQALRTAEGRLLGGRPIDVYASDACLMQMVEVATEISDSARFISGSSQVENYLGLPYRRMMFEINTGRFSGERARMGVAGTSAENDEPLLLARMLPRIFRMSLEAHGLHGRVDPHALETVTMSSLASDELRQSLVPALGDLARAMSRYLAQDPMRAIPVAQVLQDAPSFVGGSQELGGFLRLLQKNIDEQNTGAQTGSTDATLALQLAVAQATQALDRTVVAYALGTRYTEADATELYLQGFRGVAMWLPVSAQDLALRIDDFSSSLFYRELGGDWQRWLRQVLGD